MKLLFLTKRSFYCRNFYLPCTRWSLIEDCSLCRQIVLFHYSTRNQFSTWMESIFTWFVSHFSILHDWRFASSWSVFVLYLNAIFKIFFSPFDFSALPQREDFTAIKIHLAIKIPHLLFSRNTAQHSLLSSLLAIFFCFLLVSLWTSPNTCTATNERKRKKSVRARKFFTKSTPSSSFSISQ